MSLFTKFSNFFAKSESPNTLGLAFRKDALSCFIQTTQGTTQTSQLPIEQENYLSAIKSFSDKNEQRADVHIVLSASQYQIVQVDKPNMPEDEINAALKWQIKDLVTVEPENMVVDYFSGPVLAGGAEKINVVCAKKQDLTSMLSALDKDELSVKSITTEEFAFAGLVPNQEQATLLLCQQPNEEVLILIVKDGHIYFNRRLRGFAQLGSKSHEELEFGSIDSLSLEIQRSMDYFERQLKQPPIKDIQVILPIKTENYIANKLAENTTASVNILSLDETIISNKAYAAAYGAVLASCEVATNG